MSDSRKAVESLRFLAKENARDVLLRAADALERLNQAENQKSNTEKLVKSNSDKIEKQEAKLLGLAAEIDKANRDLKRVKESTDRETKEILSTAASVASNSDKRVREAQEAARAAEAEFGEASKKLSAINKEIEERKAVLAKMLASA